MQKARESSGVRKEKERKPAAEEADKNARKQGMEEPDDE